MTTRSAELRRRHRKIFGWSLAIAIAAHALVLFFGPWFRADSLSGSGTELLGEGSAPLDGLAVNVIFHPPAIVDGSGSRSQEPDWRVLSASRLIPAPPSCQRHDWFTNDFAKGEVRLVVGASGRPDSVSVSETSTDRCWDGVMLGLASDLRYRWLPSDRFPAPVELFQPVTLTLTGY